MDEIFFEIKYSSINVFNENELYKIKLDKKIGSGSYGYVFISSFYNLVIKILDADDITYYSDKNEYDVCKELIKAQNENKYIPEMFCKYYGIGYLTKHFRYTDIEEVFFPIGAKIILMPYFISFSKYLSKIDTNLFPKEVYLCNFIKKIIESQKFLHSLGYINIDLKMANIMFDYQDKVKLIDFGMCKYKKELIEFIELNEKYYIWPNVKLISYNHLLTYMCGILILEIIFSDEVYDINKDNNLNKFLVRIDKSISYTNEFKKFLINLLENKYTLDGAYTYLKYIIEKNQYHLYKDVPNIYSTLTPFEDLKDFHNFS